MKSENKVLDALLGVAIGDALGVPYEFSSREDMIKNPASDMIGYKTHNQPPGTWSDDSSLTFCLAESLINGYSLLDISSKFIAWKNKSYWTARGSVFDIGLTTSKAISRLRDIIDRNKLKELELQKYLGNEMENGNGSLMRIIPLLFHIKNKNSSFQFEIIRDVSALTHRHIRAAMSCFIYLKLAEKLLAGQEKLEAYLNMRNEVQDLWDEINFSVNERNNFKNIIQNSIIDLAENNLKSGGYVIEVLESSIWYFLKKDDFESTVISIINIGHDTDTSAAITGGLAGLYYGSENMPEYWRYSLSRYEDILDLSERLNTVYSKN